MTIEFWYLIGAALVFFMQAGFAMVETGFYESKKCWQYHHEELDGFLYWHNRLHVIRIWSNDG